MKQKESNEEKSEERIECVFNKYSKRWVPILDMYESFSGWYWYITENTDDKDVKFGLVRGFENEWGDIYMPELLEMKNKVWKVPKKNWFSNSFVQSIPKSEVGKKVNTIPEVYI